MKIFILMVLTELPGSSGSIFSSQEFTSLEKCKAQAAFIEKYERTNAWCAEK